MGVGFISGNQLSYGDLKDPAAGVQIIMNVTEDFNLSPIKGGIQAGGQSSLASLLWALSRGKKWLSVLPGTSRISLGGAIANDVHGKNQNVIGSFGQTIEVIHLRRSDGRLNILTPNDSLFRATVGGLGCTGVIERASLSVREIPGLLISVDQFRFSGLEEFFQLDETLKKTHEYTVAWIDVRDKKLRGIFLAGNHSSAESGKEVSDQKMERLSYPFCLPKQPVNLVSSVSVDVMRRLYYYSHQNAVGKLEHLSDYFFPLDKIGDFRQAFGRRGMSQYQINISYEVPLEKWYRFLELVRKSGKATFISVLKSFGDKKTPAYMTFAQKGVSIAIDFVGGYGENTPLFESFDRVFDGELVRWYPAKDGHMKYWQFEQSMGAENVRAWREHWDPEFLGSAWFNRVIGNRFKV